MLLRIVLSLSMILPALPVEAECGECPFTSMEECREWLEACCGAGDRADVICESVCVVGDSAVVESCTSECASAVSCCITESDDPGVAACLSGSACSSEDLSCGEASESRVVEGELVCLWCVCCPMGRPKPPVPQPPPVVQRPTSEKEKVKDDATCGRLDLPPSAAPQLTFANQDPPLPPDSRQAMLCVWLN
jgi:hypothetical protein